MLRSKAIVIRATGERDELVREARRLWNVVRNMPHLSDEIFDEAADEISAAKDEIDEIARLAGSLDGAAPPEERATLKRLRAVGGEVKARRRRLRAIRRDVLADEIYYDGIGEPIAA